MNHPWQQPSAPLEYSIIPTASFPRLWYRVIFIRPTDDGYEIIGQHGAQWDARAIIIRELAR